MLVPERAQIRGEGGVLVLETVRLVDDHVPPRHLAQLVEVLLDHLVRVRVRFRGRVRVRVRVRAGSCSPTSYDVMSAWNLNWPRVAGLVAWSAKWNSVSRILSRDSKEPW